MRISFGQILIVSIICILMFGDLHQLKKKIFFTFNQLKNFISKNNDNDRKKGT